MINKFLISLCIASTIICCKGEYSKSEKSPESIANSVEAKTTNKENNVSLPESWRWKSQDKSRELTIKIVKLTSDSLIAQYCAVYGSGEKLDCDFEDNFNIKAAFDQKKGTYVGTFKSFFNSGKGICSIKRTDNSLTWKILKIPSGEYYAPDECVLQKNENILKTGSAQKNSESERISNVFPLNNNNISEKISLNTSADNNLKEIFKQQYQLDVDAFSELPSSGNYNLYLVNNVSGDSDLFYLITMKGQKFTDGLEISNSNGNEDSELMFEINKNYDISIFSQTNNKRKLINTFYLNSDGKFIKK
ncbi:hypothetical protein [uncultured Chryseobacterium sp.]|uniref:hypothetical protein n=1 Tax=uncultured Chryseobacterium sp. TaxID=259322 RepID=UPI0025EDCB55|nr:hypothetical protein [uncultured Chryseobacterium sp.]